MDIHMDCNRTCSAENDVQTGRFLKSGFSLAFKVAIISVALFKLFFLMAPAHAENDQQDSSSPGQHGSTAIQAAPES